jgi:glycosyltransferase involved in cell wall biosynthesis
MKILELCEFSAGICGVWTRVLEESKRLVQKGHEVRVFSSNAVKGCNDIAKSEDNIGKIKIKRFSFIKLGGESFMHWNFEKQALEFKPDVIVAHNYRHLHTTKALKIAEKLKKQGHACKAFLVTHAPFVEGNITRDFISKIIVSLYDSLIGPSTLNKFDKIISISKWELPYLLNLGVKKNKIEYIPNGIPDEFFLASKRKGDKNKILFLGRISSIKNLSVLIKALKLMNNKAELSIAGPAEKEYLSELKNLINKLGVNVKFTGPIYDLKKKINLIQKSGIFVLPSKREAMPQALIEAMSLGKITISSDTQGGKEFILDRKNGFLFKNNNEKDLAENLDYCINNFNKLSKIRANAAKYAHTLSWSKIINKIDKVYTNH